MLKVLITDSNNGTCQHLKSIISSQTNMTVVGVAHDAHQARALIKEIEPDVVTLAIELVGMNGLAFLGKIMTLRPMPVVVISHLFSNNPLLAKQAIKLGATSYIQKPNLSAVSSSEFDSFAREVIKKLREAEPLFQRAQQTTLTQSRSSLPRVALHQEPNLMSTGQVSHRLIAIGASTGGTEAITTLLRCLPENIPGIVIAQHMPSGFTSSFAARLQGLCTVQVQEARHDEVIKSGHVYIAPGGYHLKIQKRAGCFYTQLNDEEPVSLHRPSVDVLLESVAEQAEKRGIGIILTGMGKDGAQGLLKMKQAGAMTYAQDEQSSVVYGMPRAAKDLGAVSKELSLRAIGEELLKLTSYSDTPL